MKKKVMNIRPQEFTENGERSVRYKGSDGKMHGIAPANQPVTALSIEERTKTVNITNIELYNGTYSVNEFLMEHQAGKISGFRVTEAQYSSTQQNRIYFGFSSQGYCPYYYYIDSTSVQFRNNSAVVDQITKEEFTSDMDAVKSFFDRTIGSVLDQLTPYWLYCFMKNANIILKRCSFDKVEQHVIVTDSEGNTTDAGRLNSNL